MSGKSGKICNSTFPLFWTYFQKMKWLLSKWVHYLKWKNNVNFKEMCFCLKKNGAAYACVAVSKYINSEASIMCYPRLYSYPIIDL